MMFESIYDSVGEAELLSAWQQLPPSDERVTTLTFISLFLPAQLPCVSPPHLHLDPVVSVTQVLQEGGGVGLHGGEVMLQHVDDLWQLGVAPGKLPAWGEREEEGLFPRPEAEVISFSLLLVINP